MRNEITAIAFVFLSRVAEGDAIPWEMVDQSPVAVYCKRDNLHYNATTIGCTWDREFGSACSPGGLPKTIDKRDIVELNDAFKQCSDGKWVARALTKP